METLNKYTSLITLFTVVLGWLIVNWQNNKREERKELRSSLTDISKNIEGIEDSAITYHTSLARTLPLEKTINLNISRLSSKIRHLRFDSENVKLSFIELKKSITLDNFETNRFAQQNSDSEITDSIRLACDKLKDSLEDEFSKHYRGPFRFRISAAIRSFLISCKPT